MIKRITAYILVLLVLFLTACGAGGKPDYGYDAAKPSSQADSGGLQGEADIYSPWLPTVDLGDEYFEYDESDRYLRNKGNEKYSDIEDNREELTGFESMLTFSLKVDTASYTNVQRYLENGALPPTNAVRIEEMINYFNYEAELSDKEGPFYVYTEVGPSPFDPNKLMAFLRIKTEDIDKRDLPPSHLTFLIDTSGSMASNDKLPLLKESLIILVENLDSNDYVSIVTYAGESEVVLKTESGANKNKIISAINGLRAGGSTAGANGIKTAYELASSKFLKNGNNRVILATDGDFNVGISNTTELENFIANRRETGVYLSVLGFGTGNIREDIMETLAKHGNGNYNYINSLRTAKKVLVDELGSNLFTLAKDVKSQVEFNPENVKSYRLIGYENRMLDNRDFNDDSKDAGEIGAGSDVVIMFEIELHEAMGDYKYSSNSYTAPKKSKYGNELFELRIRYKKPNEETSRLLTRAITYNDIKTRNSIDYVFACAVASFGHILRDSEYSSYISPNDILKMAEEARGKDREGYRYDFISLVKDYMRIIRY